ncbi:unnamed protein product [Nippostrongylus brasiliensis]|uniref:Uncharacterized protein n=1 Tax=Nippostrongylus brasiliensis TaxID=27835 RepID=A0A0N4XCW5_NIPBR|nr:unnamed protein product [Nippostrongylus brasiliensis]
MGLPVFRVKELESRAYVLSSTSSCGFPELELIPPSIFLAFHAEPFSFRWVFSWVEFRETAKKVECGVLVQHGSGNDHKKHLAGGALEDATRGR